MATVMKDVVTWLQQWFYTESEIDTKLSNKANKNLTTANMNVVTDSSGDITVEAKPTIPSASSTTPSADVSGGSIGSGTTWAKADHQHPLSSAYATASHSQATTTISNSETYSNLGSNLTNQKLINDAINEKIGQLVGIDFITVVSTLPTASADTMGKIYLVAISGSSDNNFKEYITVRTGTSGSYTYAWEKLGEISGSGLSVDWSDITNKPSSFTPSTHNHDDRYYTESEIDTALSSKADKTSALGTTITLVDAGETNEGCIIFNTIS